MREKVEIGFTLGNHTVTTTTRVTAVHVILTRELTFTAIVAGGLRAANNQ